MRAEVSGNVRPTPTIVHLGNQPSDPMVVPIDSGTTRPVSTTPADEETPTKRRYKRREENTDG